MTSLSFWNFLENSISFFFFLDPSRNFYLFHEHSFSFWMFLESSMECSIVFENILEIYFPHHLHSLDEYISSSTCTAELSLILTVKWLITSASGLHNIKVSGDVNWWLDFDWLATCVATGMKIIILLIHFLLILGCLYFWFVQFTNFLFL